MFLQFLQYSMPELLWKNKQLVLQRDESDRSPRAFTTPKTCICGESSI